MSLQERYAYARRNLADLYMQCLRGGLYTPRELRIAIKAQTCIVRAIAMSIAEGAK